MKESEQELLTYIDEYLSNRTPHCVDELIKIIRTTKNVKVRNAVALAFKEINDPRLLPVLIETLKDPDTKKYRARITYACESFDCTPYFPLFIELSLFDSGQTSLYAIDVIAKMKGPIPYNQLKEAKTKINEFIKSENDKERNEYLVLLLKFLNQLPTD